MTNLIRVCGTDIRVRGQLIRISFPELDSYEALIEPESLIDSLRRLAVRIDLFTFMQTPSETEPKYPYQMEWDNLAVVPVSTFDHWWNEQIRSYPRNRARQAHRR